MTARVLYSSLFNDIIRQSIKPKSNQIFVILGDTNYIDFDEFNDSIIDPDTFHSTGGNLTFTYEWYMEFYSKINKNKEFSIISYPQYSYFEEYIPESVLANISSRIIFISDNLRQVLPLDSADFLNDTLQEDEATTELPCYQAEQLIIEGDYYYSVRRPNDTSKIVDVFTEKRSLKLDRPQELDNFYIDPVSDTTSIDVFINRCLAGNNKIPDVVYVKHYPKQATSQSVEGRLKLLNAFLCRLGKSVALVEEDAVPDDFTPSDDLIALLKTYWGEKAKFRNIKLYKNPDINSQVVEVSQGRIVQTLIEEYENVRAGREYRDIFLTAPTGAGKSLLFQLPAFYISGKGNVTIVISPLIALMKDQVNAIRERGFQKVAYINSEVSLIDREAIIGKCKTGEIDILYMAPELLMSYSIDYFIGDRHIGLLVIDEAHLVTTWGRDFRVDYWYIGNYIHRIRKYTEYEFPMIAVTATAVYGGDKNDMVFDTVDSLMMHTPHYFIGIVKREDIEFLINIYDGNMRGFDKAKIDQTATFINSVNALGFKTLVYAPYTSHVRKIADAVNAVKSVAVKYYGDMDPLAKEQSERAFRNDETTVMICTKAFGMGVDIPDIQVVYHHAPSGLLPDYVQEIGRAARNEEIRGYAALNYSTKDQKYSNQLYGMSSLKLYQLKAVLRKIYQTYSKNGNKRNMLLSVDDFSFAFNDLDDTETKVKTALMMIEKDYLAKYQYNVIIARPKQLFTKVFAKVFCRDWQSFEETYKDATQVLTKRENGDIIVQLDLDKIWSRHFANQGFPALKRKFYAGDLFTGKDVSPQIKVTYQFTDKKTTSTCIQLAFNNLKSFFNEINARFFEKEALVRHLKQSYSDRIAQQLANFALSSFSGALDDNTFLQKKLGPPNEYRVISNRYEAVFASAIRVLGKLLDGDNNSATRYLSKNNATSYIQIGQMLEILEIGTFEMLSGESPMIFIRVNNPRRVRHDAYDQQYNNFLLEKTHEKHKVSTEIMDHFFSRGFSNEERWSFIEDFFLGENNEELIRKYPGKDVEHLDIIDSLRTKKVQRKKHDGPMGDTGKTLIKFPPHPGTYKQTDKLTLEIGGESVTRTIAEWIAEDPVTLHKAVIAKTISVDKQDVYVPLISRVKVADIKYYARHMGLKNIVSITGWNRPVMVVTAINENPVKFYKWWATHRDIVFIPLQEKIALFEKVYQRDPSILEAEDIKMISSGRRP